MDIIATKQAVAYARKWAVEDDKGPLLLEFVTYRYGGHSYVFFVFRFWVSVFLVVGSSVLLEVFLAFGTPHVFRIVAGFDGILYGFLGVALSWCFCSQWLGASAALFYWFLEFPAIFSSLRLSPHYPVPAFLTHQPTFFLPFHFDSSPLFPPSSLPFPGDTQMFPWYPRLPLSMHLSFQSLVLLSLPTLTPGIPLLLLYSFVFRCLFPLLILLLPISFTLWCPFLHHSHKSNLTPSSVQDVRPRNHVPYP